MITPNNVTAIKPYHGRVRHAIDRCYYYLNVGIILSIREKRYFTYALLEHILVTHTFSISMNILKILP